MGVLAAIPAVLVMAASRLGPGMTNDSVAYAVAARSFTDTGTFTTIGGAPLTQFPPGLPAVLGALGRLGFAPEASAVAINVAMVVLAVIATYWLAEAALDSPALALVPTAIVSVSTATTMTFSRLWTEPGFVVLVLVILIALTRAVRAARLSAGTVVVVALASSLAYSWRYVAIMLIPFAALGGALAARRQGPRAMALAAAGLGLASSLGFVVISVRNATVGGSSFGSRVAPHGTVRDFVVGTIETLGSYVVPDPAARLDVLLGLPLALLLAFGAWRVARTRDAGMATLTAFIAAYWLALFVIGRLTDVEYMRYRIASPAFAPLAILATFAARDLLGRLRGAGATVVRWGLAAALVLALPVALAQSAAYAWIIGRSGHGYNSRAALESPLADAVAALPANARVLTNDPIQLFWSTGRRATVLRDIAPNPSSTTYFAAFDDDIAGTSRRAMPDLPDLAGPGEKVTLVESFADGRLFAVTAAG